MAHHPTVAETDRRERAGAALARIIGDAQSRQLAEMRYRFNSMGWGIVADGPNHQWWAVRGNTMLHAPSAAELNTHLALAPPASGPKPRGR